MIIRAICFALLAVALHATCAAAASQDANTVVASRGGVSVTFGEIDEFVGRVPPDKRAATMDSPRRIEALLLNMLLNKQLARQAEEMKLDADPEVQGKTGWARVEILSRLRMQRFQKDLKVPDFEQLAKEEFIAHRDHYAAPGPIDVQRVLIGAKEHGGRDAARDLAYKVRGEAAAAPDQFDALVDKYSDDPDKATTHGIVHDVLATKPDGRLRNAVEGMQKPGEISDALATYDGFQVVKLIATAPPVPRTYEQVHDKIVDSLRSNYVDSERRDFIDHLGSQKLDANPEAVASLRTRYETTVAAPSDPAQQGASSGAH